MLSNMPGNNEQYDYSFAGQYRVRKPILFT